MDKFTVAKTLDEISRYLELSDPKPFRARAFEKAARAIENVDEDVVVLVESGRLLDVDGIGKGTAGIIEELVRTGESQYLAELRSQYPAGIFELLRVPRLGLRKIGELHAALGIGSLDALEEAAQSGALTKLKGFGAKTAEQILKGIEFARLRESQFLLPVGLEVGELIRERLADIDAIEDAEVTGSVRRRLETIRNVNIAIAVAAKKRDAVVEKLAGLVANLEKIDDDTYKGLARNEMDVWFHLSTPAEFGSTVLRTTGSREFVEAFGKIPKARTEKEAFGDTPYIEPERRESAEDLGKKKQPKLVKVEQIRGTFHVHTTFSDGRHSVLEMLTAAHARGWEYLGISDHSKAAYYAGGLSEEKLKEQHAEIRRHEPAVEPMRVFRGSEVDILGDGTMDYGDKILSKFDFVVASVHSNFKTPKDEMTARILKAMDDPHVTFLGHLTGRKLLSREGYSVDYDAIFDKAAERGVMIEINGNPHRLDVDWRYLKRAVDRGVTFSIHPDAHSMNEYNAVITGAWMARKGGLSAKHIFNTRTREEVEEFFQARRNRQGPARG